MYLMVLLLVAAVFKFLFVWKGYDFRISAHLQDLFVLVGHVKGLLYGRLFLLQCLLCDAEEVQFAIKHEDLLPSLV